MHHQPRDDQYHTGLRIALRGHTLDWCRQIVGATLYGLILLLHGNYSTTDKKKTQPRNIRHEKLLETGKGSIPLDMSSKYSHVRSP